MSAIEKEMGSLPTDTQAWIAATLAAGTTANTRRAYEQDRRFFQAWAEARYGSCPQLPIELPVALTFVADLLGALPASIDCSLVAQGNKAKLGPLTVTTLQRRITGLQDWHTQLGLAGPFRAPAIRQLLRRAQRLQATRQKHRSRPITLDILEQMLVTCGPSLQGLRDRALLMVGFFGGGRRRSELSNLDISDLETVGGQPLLQIRTSKTDQTGKGLWVPLTEQVTGTVHEWLAAAKIQDGALFRSVNRHSHLGERLTGGSINRIIKKRAEAAEFHPALYSAHGLRSGFLTECELRGLPLPEAMALSGHTSASTAIDYWQHTGNRQRHLLAQLVNPTHLQSIG